MAAPGGGTLLSTPSPNCWVPRFAVAGPSFTGFSLVTVRVPASLGEGWLGREPLVDVAQLEEHRLPKPGVVGSSPAVCDITERYPNQSEEIREYT